MTRLHKQRWSHKANSYPTPLLCTGSYSNQTHIWTDRKCQRSHSDLRSHWWTRHSWTRWEVEESSVRTARRECVKHFDWCNPWGKGGILEMWHCKNAASTSSGEGSAHFPTFMTADPTCLTVCTNIYHAHSWILHDNIDTVTVCQTVNPSEVI